MSAQSKERKTKYDIVSIGDCTIDNFIEVEEVTLSCDKNHEHCQLGFPFGDKIPYKNLTILSAGNSNNAAVGMSRLGLKSAYYGAVGNDANGLIILNKLKREKVDTRLVSVQKGVQTNSHYVLVYRHDRTILIKHQPYKYQLPKEANNTKWIYYSSVGPKGLELNSQVVKLLDKHPDIKMSFNPGTFQLRMGIKKLAPLLKRTQIMCLNKEEAQELTGLHSEENYRVLGEKLHKAGPQTVVMTDALKGAYCYHGGTLHYMGIYPHTPIESTGCGDAFATGFTAARMLGLSIEEALRWGSRNGANVATMVGPQAGLVARAKMLADLKKHKSFQPKVVNK